MKNYQSIDSNDPDVEASSSSPSAAPAVSSSAVVEVKDHLAPPFDSPERPSNLFVGTFNLIATIVGGGVFSLPIVFARCGVAFTTAAMILSACMTYASLMMLCMAGRRGGGSSYGEAVRSAFGERMEEVMSWMLSVYLMLSIVAFMVLARDIWTPLVRQVLGSSSDVQGDYVLLCIIGLLVPFLVQRSLHSLRNICYVGFASITTLCIALCHAGYKNVLAGNNNNFDSNSISSEDGINIDTTTNSGIVGLELFKVPSAQDLLFSFPIVTCAFLCHFNIMAIQNALIRPTRERMHHLTTYAVGACFILMYAFGLGGYAYAGGDTRGNILLNVPTERRHGDDGDGNDDDYDYYLFLLGRVGCGITIMLAMPVSLLPCRESLLEVLDVWFHRSHHRSDPQGGGEGGGGGGDKCSKGKEETAKAKEEEEFVWRMLRRYNSNELEQDADITTEDELVEILPIVAEKGTGEEEEVPATMEECSLLRTPSFATSGGGGATIILRHDPIQSDYVFRNTVAHYGSTFLIIALCYLGAVKVTGVATIWSFIGSSMAFLIAFIVPCGCFIASETNVPSFKEGGDRNDNWIRLAWAILLFSIVGAVVCTINNTVGF